IRTPDVTDKEEIPCEYTHRFIASCSAVCQYKGNAFRRVARGVDDFQFDIADIDYPTIFQVHGIFRHVLIFPVLITFVGDIRRRIEALGSITQSGSEIRMDMRLSDMCDVETF